MNNDLILMLELISPLLVHFLFNYPFFTYLSEYVASNILLLTNILWCDINHSGWLSCHTLVLSNLL